MTITAHDWISRSCVEPAIFERFPEYSVRFVAADHLDLTALAPVAASLSAQAHEAARSLASGEPDAHTARWHQAYRDFGIKPRVARPSADALIRRAASDKGLPSINVLVDIYNAISILHRVPIGGEDLDHYQGPARLLLATGTEPFQTTADGDATSDNPEPGEPVWVDDDGVTCRRWNWRQTTRTAISSSTIRVGFIIDSLDAPEHLGAALASEQLAELLHDPLLRTIDRLSP
jgi:DNA/RNA-binding domain of Phe-tRNA-synthetase-like protein